MTINSQPGSGDDFKLETAEEAEMRLSGNKGEKSVADIVKGGDPAELKALDDKYIVAPVIATEESPVLHDSHVERRNEEVRNKFIESVKNNAPERASSFRSISRNVLDSISEDLSTKNESYKAEKEREMLKAVNDSVARINSNCLPNKNYMETASKAFNESVDDLKGRVFQSIKEVLVANNFSPDVFDVLNSSETAEVKLAKLKRLPRNI